MSRSSHVDRGSHSGHSRHGTGDDEENGSPYVVTPAQLREGDYDTLSDVAEAVEARED